MNPSMHYSITVAAGRLVVNHAHAVKHTLFAPAHWTTPVYRPMVNTLDKLIAHYLNPSVLATSDKQYTWTADGETYRRPNAMLSVAYYDGRAYGACVVHGTQMYLYVHPEHRRCGIATALIDALRARYNLQERIVIEGNVQTIVEFRRQSGYPGRNISHARIRDRYVRKVNRHANSGH